MQELMQNSENNSEAFMTERAIIEGNVIAINTMLNEKVVIDVNGC